jgi:inactivated superfamily I helicase/CRISPR/Cas system-associated exonuclease Cas4 (RecB family)
LKLKLFSTQRQIRNWLQDKNNTLLDKHQTIGEFLNSIIVVKDKKFIDADIRKIYLFKAIENIDISRLGFKKKFLSFAKDSEFIFSFFKELFLEKVEIDSVIMSDTYIEYEEHLNLLKEIKAKYQELISIEGYIDTFLIENYEINEKLLDGIDEIEINLDGYLSKFDVEVLEKVDKKVTINLSVSKFNRSLIRKFLVDLDEGYRYKIDFKTKEILQKELISSKTNVEVSHFSKRFDEINFVFAKIAEFIDLGIEADKIAVILPDESFAEFLEEFDEYQNLNFAMGKSFTESKLFIKLEALYSYLINEDEVSLLKIADILEEYQKSENLLEFVRNLATNKELELIDETLFKLKSFENMFEDKNLFLHFVIERLKELSFDDIYSGKVTVMGVLESRGIEFEGVILVDFNEDIVPNVNSKDLFLNTAIRKKSGLPTRSDKENLQKHYYYSLINRAKRVAISYVQNEKEMPSRFIYELGLNLGENQDEKYSEVLYKLSSPKEIAFYDDSFEVKTPLYPTTLTSLLECAKKYYFSKILKIENEEESELNFGSVFHSAVQKSVENKAKINSYEEYFESIMNEIYQNMNTKKEIYEIRVHFEDAILEFCKQDYEMMKYSENLCEENVNFEFEGIKLGARIDRIDINEKSVTLIDYKTSKSLKTDYVYDFQLTFYYLYALQNYDGKTIKVAYWDIYKSEFIEITPKVDELKKILKSLPNQVTVAEDIVYNEKVVKKAIDICKYCDYKLACKGDL